MRLFFGEKFSKGFFPGDFCHFRFSILQNTDLTFQEIIDSFFMLVNFFLIIYSQQIIWDLYQKKSIQNNLISQMRYRLPLP